MSIYTIGDLHLSFSENKPMSIFGENWREHEEKIKEDWKKKVTNEDTVILPGDFSWATYLKNTIEDFKYLNKLPGKKLLLKGNHDYWWTTIASMKKFLIDNEFENIDFIHNNSYEVENNIIVGTRGWNLSQDDIDDKKIIKRENSRLEMSIKNGINRFGLNKEMIAFMHYPPITKVNVEKNEMNIFVRTMLKYNIKKCYYAHLHSDSIKDAVEGEYFGIDFKLVSADGLDFKLLKL